ncbi:MAG: hypothetical protein QW680_11725 [Pyrobaculum sp.]
MIATLIFFNSTHACDIDWVFPATVFDISRVCRREYIFVDWGVAGASGRYTISDYLRFLQKVRARVKGAIYAVVPDVLGNAEKTREYYKKYAPAVRRYADFVVYVTQEYKVFDDIDAEVIAIPMRVPCRQSVRICVHSAEALIRSLRSHRVHLLGPPREALCKLARRGLRVHSLDVAVHYTPRSIRRFGCRAIARDARCAENALLDYLTCNA